MDFLFLFSHVCNIIFYLSLELPSSCTFFLPSNTHAWFSLVRFIVWKNNKDLNYTQNTVKHNILIKYVSWNTFFKKEIWCILKYTLSTSMASGLIVLLILKVPPNHSRRFGLKKILIFKIFHFPSRKNTRYLIAHFNDFFQFFFVCI